MGCFPSLEELRIPDQEIWWWHGVAENLYEGEVERELKEGMRFSGVRETVQKYKKLSVRCKVIVIVVVARRTVERVSNELSVTEGLPLTIRQKTWDVDFSKRRMLAGLRN